MTDERQKIGVTADGIIVLLTIRETVTVVDNGDNGVEAGDCSGGGRIGTQGRVDAESSDQGKGVEEDTLPLSRKGVNVGVASMSTKSTNPMSLEERGRRQKDCNRTCAQKR